MKTRLRKALQKVRDRIGKDSVRINKVSEVAACLTC